jgi:hypothetical protein
MDDTQAAEPTPDPRTIPLTLGGVVYRFAPLTQGQITSILLAQKNKRGLMSLTTLGRVLGKSCGEDTWDEILDRLEDDAVTLEEISTIFEALARATGEH